MSSKEPWHYLYNTTRWRKCRALFLAKNPLCVYCSTRGLVTQATVLDHKTPHKGNLQLFYSESNWQSLCKPCHDSVKRAEEGGRLILGADENGIPFDPRHHWNQPGGG